MNEIAQKPYTEEDAEQMNTIWAFLKKHDDWILADDLAEAVGMKRRVVREHIRTMRLVGYHVISNTTRGFKIASNIEELDRCISSMFNRGLSILGAARGLVKSREQFFASQLNLGVDEIDEFRDRMMKAIEQLKTEEET